MKVEIADDPAPRPTGKHALRLELDGSAALLYSPQVPVGPLFSYVLSGYVKTELLKHDIAFASVLFYGKNHQLLESHESKHFRTASDWTPFQIGPVTPGSDEVRFAKIALHLRPVEANGDADLVGAAMFDDLWLGRLPRVSLETNSPHNVYTDLSEPEVLCRVSGISDPNPLVRFDLLDVDGNLLLTEEVPMTSSTLRPQAGRVFSGIGPLEAACAGQWLLPCSRVDLGAHEQTDFDDACPGGAAAAREVRRVRLDTSPG